MKAEVESKEQQLERHKRDTRMLMAIYGLLEVYDIPDPVKRYQAGICKLERLLSSSEIVTKVTDIFVAGLAKHFKGNK